MTETMRAGSVKEHIRSVLKQYGLLPAGDDETENAINLAEATDEIGAHYKVTIGSMCTGNAIDERIW